MLYKMSYIHTSFLQNMKITYGFSTYKNLKQWTYQAKKYRRTIAHTEFLLRCRSNDLKPRYICRIYSNLRHFNFENRFTHYKFQRKINRLQTDILNLEIKNQHSKQKRLKDILKRLDSQLEYIIPEETINRFYETQKISLLKYDTYLKKNKDNKFKILFDEKYPDFNEHIEIRNKWFKNISNMEIPKEVQELVSLGDKFSFKTNKFEKTERFEIVKNIESKLNFILKLNEGIKKAEDKVPESRLDNIRQKTIDIITVQNDTHKKTKHLDYIEKRNLNNLEMTNKFMEENKDIFFTKADKGNMTVAVNWTDYLCKVDNILSDQKIYERVKKGNPNNKTLESLKKICDRWLGKDFIDYPTYKRICPSSANLSRAYALPKIHKENYPYRLIVSSIGSPLHNFSKFLQPILSFCLNEESHSIKNSSEFLRKIGNLKIPEDHVMISLDVSSLFTSIPNDLIIESIERKWKKTNPPVDIPWSEIEIALELILKSTYFTFNDKIYHQIDGTPMGSPVSPIFAETVMRDLEEQCWKRYLSNHVFIAVM